MKLRKRTTALVALAVVAATVAVTATVAGAADSNAAGHKAGSAPWTIGLSNGYYGNGARVQLEAEVKAFVALPSVKGKVKKLIINNAGTSVAAQIAAVDGMIAEHVNAIILDSNSETGLNATISAAKKAGIVVVAANDRVSSKDAVQIETVGEKFGAAGMTGFVKLLHGKGNIVILRGLPGNAVDAAEAAGFHSVLKKNPGIKVLNESYGKWDDGEAQKVMADLLSRYNNIDGVFTEGGMQQGVVRAYVAAKRKFVPVAGTDENGFACQLKKYQSQGLQGVQVGSALYADALATKTALDILGGKKIAGGTTVPVSWGVWNTAQSISHCNASYSPSLFLGVSNAAAGINLTPQQVLKYMK
jgi:ribose transport system substrate-binding protein